MKKETTSDTILKVAKDGNNLMLLAKCMLITTCLGFEYFKTKKSIDLLVKFILDLDKEKEVKLND